MFIDTHCHLTGEYCDGGELDAVIRRAMDAGVGALVCATARPEDWAPALALCEKYDNVFCTIGIHPEAALKQSDAVASLRPKVEERRPKVLGIGEIGLDYHYGADDRDAQIELFEQQLEIARQCGLPVAIHTRDAEEDTARILDGSVRGVMHCFTSSWNLARIMLDRGFYFSASGILTFKNAAELRETFAKIPSDRIVIETDSPYCAPAPHRGQKCEPAMIVETAKVLAQIKNLQLEELGVILAGNTERLYPKIKL
jgi:TatD DNase family protein